MLKHKSAGGYKESMFFYYICMVYHLDLWHNPDLDFLKIMRIKSRPRLKISSASHAMRRETNDNQIVLISLSSSLYCAAR